MVMAVTRVLPDTTGMLQLESRTGSHLSLSLAQRLPFSRGSCRIRLTRKIEFGGQSDFFRSLMRKGHYDMATGLHISPPIQRGSLMLRTLRRLLLLPSGGIGWTICGRM